MEKANQQQEDYVGKAIEYLHSYEKSIRDKEHLQGILSTERAVLGAMLQEPGCIGQTIHFLREELFFSAEHKAVFSAIESLSNRGAIVDLRTAYAECRRIGNGIKPEALAKLTSCVSSSANIQQHCIILLEDYMRRKAMGVMVRGIDNLADPTKDVFETTDEIRLDFESSVDVSLYKQSVSIHSSCDALLMELMEGTIKKADNIIRLGFRNLDNALGSVRRGNLMIVAARPSMGKTSFAIALALELAKQKKKVSFFSLEMGTKEISERVIANVACINSIRIARQELKQEQIIKLGDATKSLKELPLMMEDPSNATIETLRAKMLTRRKEDKPDVIIIDYLQLMRGKTAKGSNRESEISSISRGLKQIARENNLLVIALSQLNRELEKREGGKKRPILSDLRDSGSIEQDADIVLMLCRPHYYKIEQSLYDVHVDENLLEVAIQKNRLGSIGGVPMQIDLKTSRITEDFDGTHKIKNPAF